MSFQNGYLGDLYVLLFFNLFGILFIYEPLGGPRVDHAIDGESPQYGQVFIPIRADVDR